ncbi:MAG TPA: MBL fold metallo-hydrolase [Candidatus Binatia bacterium]|jgi:L-ascorbate metabolism protein UlaG (beta-lactamase superfamily)
MLLITILLWGFLSFSAHVAETPVAVESPEKVVLKWLGNAGWEIRLGKTTILIDPFLTRKERSMDAEWKTDEEAVLKIIKGADYIFAGHSHHDHIGDVPFIAKRFGSKIIGSQTTASITVTAGVNPSQVVTIKGGEKLDFKEFSVQVIESRHAILQRSGRRETSRREEILKPWAGPIMGRDFVEGGTFLYYFNFGGHRVLHQSTANFVEEKLSGLHPDVALLAEGEKGYNLENALKILKPKVVIIQHFDEWRAPFSQGIPPANLKRAQRFDREVRAADRQIKTIIPEFFMTHTLEP